jgi:hypothetical protein
MARQKLQLNPKFSNFVIELIELSCNLMVRPTPDDRNSMKALFWLIQSIRQVDREELKDISNELFDFLQKKRIVLTPEDIVRIYSTVCSKLHEFGYCEIITQRPETRESGFSNLETTIAEAKYGR